MDVATGFLVVGFVVLSGAVLLIISMFGIKEKSYEEAIAEQKQQSNVLFGSINRAKSKEKKQKKVGKKVKEKLLSGETETNEETDNGSAEVQINEQQTNKLNNAGSHAKPHVEFKEPAIVESEKENIPTQTKTSLQKRTKRDKVRPILVNKDVSPDNVIDNVVEVPPANHFDTIHPKDEFELLHTKEEVATKQEVAKEKPKKHSEDAHKSKKVTKHQQPQTVDVAINTAPIVEEKKPEPIQEPTTVANLNGIVTNTTKEKKKRKAELNTLQQLTGDKQGINATAIMKLVRTAEMSRYEVQTLIDLLLDKQQEAPVILDEWSEGKADPVQKLKKQLAEKEKALQEEQEALISAQAKLREIRAEQNAERSNLQQRIRQLDEIVQTKQVEIQTINGRMHGQVQQLKAQLNEEIMKTRKMCEEHTAMHMQRQQLEMRLGEMQEAEATIVQLRNELQELQSRSSVEIHNLKEQQMNAMTQLQHQLNIFKNDIAKKDDMIRTYTEREENYSLALRQEAELKGAFQQKVEEIRRLNDELNKLQDDSDRTANQLRSDLQKSQEEKKQLQEANINGSREINKVHQIEILNLKNELESVRSQLQQTHETATAKVDETIKKLEDELQEQKTKNNDLREKNWKVMEALQAAEARIKSTKEKEQSNVNLEEEIKKVILHEQEQYRMFIQRLFPDIKISTETSQEKWLENIEGAIEKHIAAIQETKSGDVSKLQAELKYYKTIIDDTEGMLNKLQAHIETEEINWRNQLKLKDEEIAMKEQQIVQLKSDLADTQRKLELEQEARQKLVIEIEALKKVSNKKPQADSVGVVEKLSQDVDRLREQLLVEQKKNEELLKSSHVFNTTNLQNHNNTTNGTAIASEQLLSSTSSAASSLTDVNIKPKNKKKKKKNNQ